MNALEQSPPIAPNEPPSSIVIPLQRTPLWNQSLIIFMALAFVFTSSKWLEWQQTMHQQPWLLEVGTPQWPIGLTWLVGLSIMLLLRWYTRRFPLAPIELHPTSANFPRSAESTKRLLCKYTDILAVHILGSGEQQWFIIETKQQYIRLPIRLFATMDGPRQLLETLQDKLLEQEDHRALLTIRNEERQAITTRLQQRIIIVPALLILSAIFWIAMYSKHALSHPIGMWRWGALLPTLVHEGQWYRLLLAPLLQADWLDGAMQGVMIWLLGGLVERALGPIRMAGFLLSTTGCSMAIASLAPSMQVRYGAMPLTIAIVVAFGLLRWHWRRKIPFTLQESSRFWLIMASLWILFAIPLTQYDLLIAAVAIACGVLWLLPILTSKALYPNSTPAGLQTLVWIGVGLFCVALIFGIVQAKQAPEEDYVDVARRMLETSLEQPDGLNQWAWQLAQADMPPEDPFLQLAADKMLAMCSANTAELMYLDTLAAVWLQQERYASALPLAGYIALRSGMQHDYTTQLANILLEASLRGRKPVALLAQATAIEAHSLILSVSSPATTEQLLAIVQDGQQILGFARLQAGEQSTYHCPLSPQVALLLGQRQLQSYQLPLTTEQLPEPLPAILPTLPQQTISPANSSKATCTIHWLLPAVFRANTVGS